MNRFERKLSISRPHNGPEIAADTKQIPKNQYFELFFNGPEIAADTKQIPRNQYLSYFSVCQFLQYL